MTVKVVGHWERAWRSPLEEFNSWIHPLKEFGVEHFFMCPVTGVDLGRVTEFNQIKDVLDNNQLLTHVYVDEQAEEDLQEFTHPEHALYIFGKTQFSPYKLHYRPDIDKAVKIPSIKNGGGFWGDQTMAIILYDRYIKMR